MYSNMYSISIKIPIQNEGQLQLVDDFVRKYVKAVTVTDSVFTTWKIYIKSISVNWDARSSSYEFYETRDCNGSGLIAIGSI